MYGTVCRTDPLFSVSIFCLRPVLLHVGPRHNGKSDAITNFIFTHFHNMKQESVASRLTKNIRSNIKGEEVSTRYNSRSNLKGVMTKNKMHWNLSTQDD